MAQCWWIYIFMNIVHCRRNAIIICDLPFTFRSTFSAHFDVIGEERIWTILKMKICWKTIKQFWLLFNYAFALCARLHYNCSCGSLTSFSRGVTFHSVTNIVITPFITITDAFGNIMTCKLMEKCVRAEWSPEWGCWEKHSKIIEPWCEITLIRLNN